MQTHWAVNNARPTDDQSYKNPGWIDGFPHRVTLESPPFCCPARRIWPNWSPPPALLSSLPSSKSFQGWRRKSFAVLMNCKRCPKATFRGIVQVSVRYFLLRSRAPRAAYPFCSSLSARHPSPPRMYFFIKTVTPLLRFFFHSPSSPFIPPVVGPLAPSPVPTPAPIHTGAFFLSSPVASLTAVIPELDRSISYAELGRGGYSTIKSRMDSPVVDPRFSTSRSLSPDVGTSYIPANSLDLASPSRPTTPATQRWPLPPSPVRTVLESAIRTTLGGRSDYERSPSPPFHSSMTPVRHGVSIAELVDEENSSPGTRGGMNTSHSAATRVNMSSAQYYPPLSISITDVTPRPIGRDVSEIPRVLQTESPRSSLPSPRHSKRKRASPTTPEVPEGRMTRGSVKRKAAENSEMKTEFSKRVKTGSS